jgi:ribonuclease D
MAPHAYTVQPTRFKRRGNAKGSSMPIGWLSVLKAVPWTEVITNAPKVAEGAKKLWSSVGKKAPAPPQADARSPTVATPGADALTELESRLVAMESVGSDLHNQMLASSELIKALAEQNSQLIRGIEANRIRLRWLVGAVVALGVVALANLMLTLAR